MCRYCVGTSAFAILLCALPTLAQVQQAASPEASTSGQPKTQDKTSNNQNGQIPADQEPNTPKNDRLFGVLPNYTTVENEDRFGPLSTKEKFKLSAESMFDPVTFPFIGFVALIGQAEDTEPSYGQGLKGYAKRYGTSYGDAGIGTTMTTSVFPSLLRQDPRYFQLGKGGIWHRAGYSLSRIFVTRTDSGDHEFNYSEIVGNAVAAGISNAYHPEDDRTLANTLSVWGTDIMWDAAANEAKEFWPDIRRKLHKKHDNDAAP
jgi:hypothetical protein